MVKIGKVADWLWLSAPLLDAEITESPVLKTPSRGQWSFAMDKETLTRALASKAGRSLRTRASRMRSCHSTRECCG